ncbi:MAG: enoyl-CoA hydratase/isomerase family protein [bacterium]|nr:enoyl-CoA hydratase/isomerase family protein [bacterium]
MSKELKFEYEDDVLKTYIDDEIAVIKIKSNVFDAIANLAESGKFLSLINTAERINHVKVLMLINCPGCYNEEAYDKFLTKIKGEECECSKQGIFEKIDRTREINILNRVISQLMEFKKITVMAMQGNITTPFFGAGLSMDFRFGSEDMSFSLPHLKHGIHPGGGLPFFLPHFVGHGKAVEILFKGKNIPAREALELGLITDIFPNEKFESECIREARELCKLDSRSINTTKMLVNFSRSALRHYFDLESALLH